MAPPVTLVTGAAGGLGSAVVDVLSKSGQRVAACVLDAEQAARYAGPRDGEKVAAFEFDVGDPAAWSSTLERVESTLGAAPSGAVLTVGGWAGGSPLAGQAGADHWASMSQANVASAHTALRALLPGMIARGKGRIVVIGSRAVERPWESAGAAAYAASKAALVALCQAAAAEVLDSGVTINAVLPSTIDTAANRRAMPKADPSKWVAPTSLAQVIGFLLSDAARDISGAAIPVYGRV
jgi:NAD(P)-dependent dehydrogenase (short-subunit alcohol dehydrogenase family)